MRPKKPSPSVRLVPWAFFMALALVTSACAAPPPASDVLVTEVAHSKVRRQSIGNCWLYAASSWAESLHLSATGTEIDISESYWSWWHIYSQLVGSTGEEVQTGGWWSSAVDIMDRRGVLAEGLFVPDEGEAEMSVKQADAVSYINKEMRDGGRLFRREQRTPIMVRTVLDEAFGSVMAEAEQLAVPAHAFVAGWQGDNQILSLKEVLDRRSPNGWSEVSFPRIYGQDVIPRPTTQRVRDEIMLRVLRALNDGRPVVMSLMVDFNALDPADATFKRSLAEAAGMGQQGGHMVALSDYVVDDVPGIGTIGEGNVSDDEKILALDGNLRYLVSKNSWGTNRPDRGLTDGFTRFDKAYLEGQLPWRSGEDDEKITYYTTLTGFVLPPGY